MNGTLIATVLGVLLGSSTGVIGVLLYPKTRRKLISEAGMQDATAAQEVSAAAVSLVAPLRVQIQDLLKQLAEANQKVGELEVKCADMSNMADQAMADLRASHDENARLRALLA